MLPVVSNPISNGSNRFGRSHSAPFLSRPPEQQIRRRFSAPCLSFDPLISQVILHLVKRYEAHPSEMEEIISKAEGLINAITERDFNKGDFEVIRTHLCDLLQLRIPSIEEKIVKILSDNIFNPSNLAVDITNNWVLSFIDLEKRVSEIINFYTRNYFICDGDGKDEVIKLIDLYQHVLERLCLFSLLESDHQLEIRQHLQTVETSVECWLSLIEKYGQHDQRLTSQAMEMRSVLQYIRTSGKPSEIVREIGKVIDYPISLFILLGDLCAHMGFWTHTEFYYHTVLLIFENNALSKKEQSEAKLLLLKRLASLCTALNNNDLFRTVVQLIKKIDSEAFGKNTPVMALALSLKGFKLTALNLLQEEHNRPPQVRDHKIAISSLLRRSIIYGNLGAGSQTFEDSQKVLELIQDWVASSDFKKTDCSFIQAAMKETFALDCDFKMVKSARFTIYFYNVILNIIEEKDYFEPRENDPSMVARLLLAEKQYEQAVELFEKLYTQSQKDVQHPEIVDDFLTLGLTKAYWKTSQYQKAINLLETALPLWRAQGEVLAVARCCLNLGYLYSFLGSNVKAETYFKDSISAFSTEQRDLEESNLLSITFFESRALAYIGLESVLLKQGKKKTNEAILCSDARRSPILVSNISKRLTKQTGRRFSTGLLTIKQMQALAVEHNTVFVSYSFTVDLTSSPNPRKLSKQLWVRVIPPTGDIVCKEIPYADLPEEIKKPELLFESFPYDRKERATLGNSPTGKFRARLSRWYNHLISPIEDCLNKVPGQTLTIVPDGVLAYLPFAAFMKGKNYLIEKFPVSVVPSIEALKLLHYLPPSQAMNCLLISNPTTPDPKVKSLPRTEDEVEKVRIVLNASKNSILTKEGATVSHVLREMPNARFVHSACHAVAKEEREKKKDPHSVFEGHLLLAGDDAYPTGFLHAQSISSLYLDAELVFMSGCESGRGKLLREGILGHNWAFLATGARSTISTYWSVYENDLTVKMVELFYRHLFGNREMKLNKAQALRKAMKMAIKECPNDPDIWGSFFLSGMSK